MGTLIVSLVGLVFAVVVGSLIAVCLVWPIATVFVAPLLFTVFLVWLLKSTGSIGKDEVGVRTWFGNPELRVFYSGTVFVPWFFGIRFDGRTLCELVRVSTRQLPFNFKGIGGIEEQLIWSSDRIALLVDLTGYARFPTDEPESLCLMIRAGVPLEEIAFAEWIRPEVVAGLRDILAKFDHKQAIERSNLSKVRKAAKAFFLSPTGLFATSGICGNDAENFTEGHGEVIVRIDIVKTDEELRKAMAKKVVAGYEADAAKETAKVEKTLAGDPIRLAMEDWIESQRDAGETAARAKKRLIKDGAYAKHELIVKDIILAGGGNLQVAQNLFGSPDGSPLPGSLQYFSAGGGGGAGILIGGQTGGNPAGGKGGQGQQGNNPGNQGGGGQKRGPSHPPTPGVL